jgi:hypothetical protein
MDFRNTSTLTPNHLDSELDRSCNTNREIQNHCGTTTYVAPIQMLVLVSAYINMSFLSTIISSILKNVIGMLYYIARSAVEQLEHHMGHYEE